jgi:hypothetical protein
MLWYLQPSVYKHIQIKHSSFILASNVIIIYFYTYINHYVYLNICMVNRNHTFISVLMSCNFTIINIELIHVSKLIARILSYYIFVTGCRL